MDAILPFKIKNEQKFYESALKVGYNEMEIYKFIYVTQQSDLDIFPKMQDERINVLLYGWELCEDYKQKLNPNEWELPEEMETVLKLLVPWSMDIWFSKEWDKCKYLLKSALIHCLNRARDLLTRMPDMMQINWDFLLLYNLKPWNVLYLKNLSVTKEMTLETGAHSIETEELPATDEDVSYVKLEQLPIIVLRLVKIFDQSSIDMVKTLCMRVITAWNKIHQIELETSGSRRPYIPPEDKRCLLLICHIYLMAVYESDDVKGYVIDNMISNIRFYYQGFQNSTPVHAMDNLEYTPARYIALTNIHLRVQKRDFFDFFIWNKYDTSQVNLFGVVSQAYKSYLLGNLLMELNNMNEDDFAANAPLYKRLMNSYVNEREKSEMFLINELNKIEAQRYAHNIIQTVKNVTDFKSKICKGNRMSNIGNYENSDDTVAPLGDKRIENDNAEIKEGETNNEAGVEEIEDELERVRIKESELRLDPVFQYLPNNENILYYVYDVLAKKDYKGWHFAKIVVLVKIIGLEQNMIETWRYHPGLTTDFMLNLEIKLSNHYVDLAKIFKDHPFLEQEFWLTAFYLNPTPELYEIIKRLGMRNNRKRTEEHTKLVMSIDNIDAKYGLLSSTIDVKELATMSNTDDPIADYEPLFAALHSLRVPDSLVKDMLTAIFLPRNRSFAWSLDWVILRNRCKMILTSSKEKKRFVDLNMAEANERLKYLIIDYEKYKNRPQLDYGTIEEGYENLMTTAEFDKESEEEEEEEEEEEDFEDDEDVYESKRRGRNSAATGRKKQEEKVEDDNSQEDDPFLMGKRRTRARTAATLASFLFQTLPRTSRRRKNPKLTDEETEEKISADHNEKCLGSKSPVVHSESHIPSPATASCDQKDARAANVPTKILKECLKERPAFLNTTQGFQNLIDIWNVEKSDLQVIDENCVSLLESSTALQIAMKLKLLNKEINPLGCDEKEYIDDKEMIIHNAEFVIKKEYDLNTIKDEKISDLIEEFNNFQEPHVAVEIDNNKENVETHTVEDRPEESEIPKEPEGLQKHFVENVAASGHEIADIDHNQEIFPIEENSRESINSNMSIAANKGSGEVSESNTEINSKRNSLNLDWEMEDKIIPNENIIEQSETVIELKESTENELHIRNEKQQENSEINQEDKLNDVMHEDSYESAKEELGTAASGLFEKLSSTVDNKTLKDRRDRDNEKGNQEGVIEQLGNIATSSCNETWEESRDINNKLGIEETEPVHLNNKDANISNKILEELFIKDNAAEQQQLEYSDISNPNERSEEPKDVDSESKNIETEVQQLENTEPSDNNTSEKSKNIDNKNKFVETKTQHLETIDDDNHKLSEEKIMAHCLGNIGEIKNNAVLTERIKSDVQDVIAKDVDLSADSHNELNSYGVKEKSSHENLNAVQSEILQEIESIEITTISEELSINNEESLQEQNSEEKSIGSQHGVCKTKQMVENTENDVNSKENQEAFENNTKLKLKANNSNQDTTACTREMGDNKDELQLTKSKTSDDRDSWTDLKNIESNFVTHHSTNEELDKTSAITDQSKLEEVIKCKKATESTAHQEKFDKFDCEKEIPATTNQEKPETIEYKIETCVANDEDEQETSDIEKAASASDDQTKLETTGDKRISPSATVLSESDLTLNTEDKESSDGETQHLKNLCLTRSVKVSLRKLTPADLTTLRQPKIKVQRLSFENCTVVELRSKRRCIEGRVYVEFEDSSNSNNSFGTNTSSSEVYRPTKPKKKLPIRRHPVCRKTRTSESDNDSGNSDDYKLSTIMTKSRKRRLSTASTSQSSTSQHVTGPKSARKSNTKSTRRTTGPKSTRRTTGPKSSKQNLVVTPRSASGLKLRISSAEQNPLESEPVGKRPRGIVYDEVIQLSSSSDECAINDLSAIEEVIEVEEYPLFEEEIII